MIIINEIAERN